MFYLTGYTDFVKETIAIIAALLAIVGNAPYLIDILKGRVKPHAYTWFVWSIVSAIILFGQLSKGAGVGAIPTAASEIFTIIIFLFSLKFGFKGITKIDTFFLCLALLGLIPWLLTKDPTVSVIIAVLIDVIAFVPTIRKTWLEPKTETSILFGMNVVRHTLALFSLQAYNIATTLHSIVMITANSLMTVLILQKKKRKYT
ncbi:MAG: hypothetical protein Greene07147_199 [Parcubacteria group bacterium Greene0714_7]|nr:MAG: hypothetical protein Greene07147_199 [Parcubacteria group bacterium Greene0714_7]